MSACACHLSREVHIRLRHRSAAPAQRVRARRVGLAEAGLCRCLWKRHGAAIRRCENAMSGPNGGGLSFITFIKQPRSHTSHSVRCSQQVAPA